MTVPTSGMVLIAPPLQQALCQAALQALPEECCGLLVGVRDVGSSPLWRVQGFHPMRNIWTGQSEGRRSFAVAPQDLIGCYRAVRAQGGEVIGHYHSHPNGRAGPSPRDCASITDPDALWLIAAVGGDLVDLTAWVPRSERAFAPLGILPDDQAGEEK